MGRAKNTIKESDISSTPIKVKYSVTYASQSLVDYGITTNIGVNIPYSASMSAENMQKMNNYRAVRQLYYQQSISGQMMNSASYWDPMWQSTAASGTLNATTYHFPTQSNATVLIFAIPSSQFGEQVSRKSIVIEATGGNPYKLVDDSNGNVLDASDNNTFVGNIFYSQGVIVITNPDYTVGPEVITFLITEFGDTEPIITENDNNIIV